MNNIVHKNIYLSYVLVAAERHIWYAKFDPFNMIPELCLTYVDIILGQQVLVPLYVKVSTQKLLRTSAKWIAQKLYNFRLFETLWTTQREVVLDYLSFIWNKSNNGNAPILRIA